MLKQLAVCQIFLGIPRKNESTKIRQTEAKSSQKMALIHDTWHGNAKRSST
jgi:hypothetical protein